MNTEYSLMPLPGLRENNPRDFLATLGFLRLIELQWPGLGPLLAWDIVKGHPILWTTEPLPADWSAVLTSGLQEMVKDSVKTPKGPLFHGSIIKASVEKFRTATNVAVKYAETHMDQPLAALGPLLYAAYSPQTEQKGELDSTDFSFGNGQSGKNLLLDVAQVTAGLKLDTLELSVLGQAAPVSAKTLRWNPAEFRSAAYRSHDPGKGIKGDDTLDFPAFNVLAFFGLTFLPCAPTSRRGLTAGMHSLNRETFFQWPIWDSPLSAQVIFTLLLLDPVARHHPRGAKRWWQSRRFSSDKSLYFSSATAI